MNLPTDGWAHDRYAGHQWERLQKSRQREREIANAKTVHNFNLVQRVSENRKNASQIGFALPGHLKNECWRGVRRYLLSGEGC